MAKIIDYPKVSELQDTNVFLIDGRNGTKNILAHDLAKALLKLLTSKEFANNVNINGLTELYTLTGSDKLLVGTDAGNKAITINDAVFELLDSVATTKMRRQYYRGKNLGSVVTSDQFAEIKAGTFEDMFVGDYWRIGGRNWEIVDFDYWLGTGDTECTTHHLVIMPSGGLYNKAMNSTNTTAGGYVGSEMYKTGLNDAKTIINGAFGSQHILNHREYLTNGYPSGGAWYDSTVVLPNEIMMYGSHIFTPAGNGTVTPERSTIDKTQLAGMAANPKAINYYRQSIWIRDVSAANYFTGVESKNYANVVPSSWGWWVRPVFGLVG